MMWPDPEARQELSIRPALVSQIWYFLAVYFTINPHLFHLRLWLIPPTLASIWSLCIGYAFKNPALNSFNFGVTSVGATMALKLVEFATLKGPPKCDGQAACPQGKILCWDCMVGAVRYMGDPRCLHWNKSKTGHVPEDTRRDGSHAEFYFDTLVLLVKRAIYTDILLAFLASLNISESHSIFRDTFAVTNNYIIRLPHPFVGALLPAFATGLLIMNVIELEHDLATLLNAPSSLSQPASSLKAEWPPLFDSPYRASSLRDFWTNRWQGMTRRNFASTGGNAGRVMGGYVGNRLGQDGMQPLGSRIGYVMGTFFMSGLIHDIGTWGMGGGMDFWRVTGYFLIQGVGVIVESVFELEKVSGQKERKQAIGSNGKLNSPPLFMPLRYVAKVWVPLWVVLPATMMAEAWLQRGFASSSLPYSPSRALLTAWSSFAYGE